jgi:hypothetical protein
MGRKQNLFYVKDEELERLSEIYDQPEFIRNLAIYRKTLCTINLEIIPPNQGFINLNYQEINCLIHILKSKML